MASRRELALLRFHEDVGVQLEELRDADKALKLSLKMAREAFRADESCVATVPPGKKRAELRLAAPQSASWELERLAAYFRGERPKLPHDIVLAPLERRGRSWGVLGLRRRGGEFSREEVRDVVSAARAISRLVQRIDRMRLAEVRARIDRKVMAQLRPNDLFYQILHGLRTLTRYDHSSAILIHDTEEGELALAAEQIAWRKGKSLRIGERSALPEDARTLLERGGVWGFDRVRGRWKPHAAGDGESVASLLHDGRRAADDRRGMSMLVAALTGRAGLSGVLKIASSHPGSLGTFEAELVKAFLPQASLAIENLERRTSLESGMLAAERKHVVAGLARGVSHDVNNAFGSVLPLVQQMIADCREGRVDAQVFAQDLEQIEASLQVCRRIFGGMLSFARGSASPVGSGNVRRSIETTLSVLEESFRRSAIEVELLVADELPLVRSPQGDLEQLFLNLATNARDAMGDGGRLSIRVQPAEDGLEIELADTGCGIPPEDLARVREPFFTTKAEGNGLGLSICRSILWKVRGRMSIDSHPNSGTRVALWIPRDSFEEDGAEP